MEISKKLVFILLIVNLCVGCTARKDFRPQRNSDEIWVCTELGNTYFYWNEKMEAFIGAIEYNDYSYDFVLGASYGLYVGFYSPKVLESDTILDEDIILSGFADYQKNKMPIQITEDKQNILNGEFDKLTFIPMGKEEYFKENQPLKTDLAQALDDLRVRGNRNPRGFGSFGGKRTYPS